ncbi:Gfo/Idh/MocA family protein [Dactylosporangium sp. CA-233914]|uniref:Gfo/Idh/MocA family protein n=1 Tax=Dactylosporangium sp. CA-233914 TaxID=3239934 RepID=UPI003D8D6D66
MGRVGLIGAGAWARACHLPALASRVPDIELVAVADADPARAQAAAREFGFSSAYAQWQSVLAHNLDACVIASPAVAHHEQALAALRCGAHVLVEKPFTLRADHAVELSRTARETGRALLAGFGWNHSALFTAAQRMLSAPGIGAVEHVSVHMASGTRDLFRGDSLLSSGTQAGQAAAATWTDPVISGGGYGHGQLSHALGVLFGLLDDPIADSQAWAMIPPGGQVETSMAIGGRLHSGATIAVSGASFAPSIDNARHQLDIRLFGSEGMLLLDFGHDSVRLSRMDGHTEFASHSGVYDGSGPVRTLIDITLGLLPATPHTGQAAVRTVEALESAYRSLGTIDGSSRALGGSAAQGRAGS